MLRVDGKLCGVAPEEGADEQARLMEFVVPTLSAVVGRLEALEEVRARADARADTGETMCSGVGRGLFSLCAKC